MNHWKHVFSYCSLFFFIFAFTPYNFLLGQNVELNQRLLDTLCSDTLYGRGYVGDGMLKAANFISKKFQLLGLIPLTGKSAETEKSYFQSFYYSVNTFDGVQKLKINDRNLIPGHDFIISPSSPAIHGDFKIIHSREKQSWWKRRKAFQYFSNSNLSQYPTLRDSIQQNLFGVKGFLVGHAKTTAWGVSTNQSKVPTIHFFYDSLQNEYKKMNIHISSKLNKKFEANNVIGMIKGKTHPDSFIVVTAHYDHLGKMGNQAIFPGANDNASGIVMLLDLASYFNRPENKPNLSILFIAFAGEEAGLIGSSYYVSKPLKPLSKIKFLINLDLVGFGEEGMMVVNGLVHNQEFELLKRINTTHQYLPQIKGRGSASNSDHYFFSKKGVPAFFCYTLGGAKAYHDVFDLPINITWSHYSGTFNLIKDFVIVMMP